MIRSNEELLLFLDKPCHLKWIVKDDAQAGRFTAIGGYGNTILQRFVRLQRYRRSLDINHDAIGPQDLHGELIVDGFVLQRLNAEIVAACDRVVVEAFERGDL